MKKPKRPKEKSCWTFDLETFVARLTPERIDIETLDKSWKVVFLANTTQYLSLAKMLLPGAFPHDPQCVELSQNESAKEAVLKNTKDLALVMFATASLILYNPLTVSEIWAVLERANKRIMEQQKKPLSDTADEQVIAEERALSTRSEEDVVAASQNEIQNENGS